MICKECDAHNPHPRLQAVHMPVQPSTYAVDEPLPVKAVFPIRWACSNCGRYHFRDGSLYDFEEAKRLWQDG